MGVRQRTGGPPLGNFSTMPVSRHTASRCGPSHCGQSSAQMVADGTSTQANAAESSKDFGCTARNVVKPPTSPQSNKSPAPPASASHLPRLLAGNGEIARYAGKRLPLDFCRGARQRRPQKDRKLPCAPERLGPNNGSHLNEWFQAFSAPARIVWKCGGCSSRATTLISTFLNPASSSQRCKSLSAKPSQRSP